MSSAKVPGAEITASEALAITAMSALLFVVGGSLLLPLGSIGIVATQLIAFACPALFIAYSKPNPRAALALDTAPIALVLAAGLIGTTLWYWNVHWVAPLSASWSPPERAAQWTEVVAVNVRPLWESILLFAAVPAICEELLHRGVIAPAIARRLGTPAAVLLSGLLFGLSHFNLARLLPTALLGGFAAYLRLRSHSLWPAITVHFLSNCSLLLAASGQWELPSLWAYPCALLTLLGLEYTRRRRATHQPP
ncbi:MAG: CPBP family intramembrane metalloprotease [Kofleriaceae bacterium]|nr:CPBP family intramembrane metalloprotease [Kofleriaceae bacterium]